MAISGSLGPSLTRLGDQLRQRDLTVAVAESMTAGLLAATLALYAVYNRMVGVERMRLG